MKKRILFAILSTLLLLATLLGCGVGTRDLQRQSLHSVLPQIFAKSLMALFLIITRLCYMNG